MRLLFSISKPFLICSKMSLLNFFQLKDHFIFQFFSVEVKNFQSQMPLPIPSHTDVFKDILIQFY